MRRMFLGLQGQKWVRGPIQKESQSGYTAFLQGHVNNEII